MRKTLLSTVFSLLLAPAATANPNILMVLADDMGVDASPCHAEGSDMVRMPTLSALCKNGMVFDNAHAAPVCSPTRAMILTGKYPSRTGVGSASAPLNDKETSLFDRLTKTAPDYATGVIGKWHLGQRNDLNHPARMGVPYFFGFTGGGIRDYAAWTPVENGRRGAQTTRYSTSLITDKAIEWIDRQSDPWFLWLAYNAPHTPFHAPPAALHSFRNLRDTNLNRGQDARGHYYAMLEALDTELGRLLDALPADTRRETVVIFAGDNGTPGQIARRQNTVKNGKASLFDGGTRVPLVVAGPGITSGHSDAPVVLTDLFATILDLAGGKNTASDSHSITPILSGTGPSLRPAAYVEMFGQKSRRSGQDGENGWMIRAEGYALVNIDGQDPMLFDMKKDPRQTRDLLAGTPNKSATSMAQALFRQREALLE